MVEYGANVLLAPHVFGRIADFIQDDLYVFPVSIEAGIFALPVKQWSYEEAKRTRHVACENALATSPKYALAKTVYKYERKTGKIIMLNK